MINWDELARRFGFGSPVEMVLKWYWGDGVSALRIRRKLGVSRTALNKFMMDNFIPRQGQSALYAAPECPKCGNARSLIYETYLEDGDTCRYRRCTNCKHSFKTLEIVKGE